jgi:hypothetical protein
MTKLLTIPFPGAAFNTMSTLPKNMYQLLIMVGASVSVLMVNTAPLVGSYVKVVPVTRLNSELAPFLKSTVIVVPRALSGGQAALCQFRSLGEIYIRPLQTHFVLLDYKQ